MSKEIERKFLVADNKWKKFVIAKADIQQGYLSKSPKHNVRIRIKQNGDKDPISYVTIKGPKKGISRDEFEYSIPHEDAVVMLQMCEQGIIHKTRYTLALPESTKGDWIVDVFKGINKGLTLAEVEFLFDGQQIGKLPDWLGEEVTHDKRYTSSYLSNNKVA